MSKELAASGQLSAEQILGCDQIQTIRDLAIQAGSAPWGLVVRLCDEHASMASLRGPFADGVEATNELESDLEESLHYSCECGTSEYGCEHCGRWMAAFSKFRRALAQGQKESGQAIWSTVDLSKASTCPPDNRNRQGQRSEAESSPDISARTDEAQSSDHPTEQDADALPTFGETQDLIMELYKLRKRVDEIKEILSKTAAHLARKEQ